MSVGSRSVDNLATDHGEQRHVLAELLHRLGHIVLRKYGEVGELPRFERSALTLIEGNPSAAHGVVAQGVLTAGRLLRSTHGRATGRLAVKRPLQDGEGIVS